MGNNDAEQYIQVPAGYGIGYELLGKGTEPPIVLLNGSLFNYRQWDTLISTGFKPILRGKYPILRYDYGGTGRSPRKQVTWDVHDLAKELKQLLDVLGIAKAHIFGISKGTIVGQVFAGRYPERVATLGGYGWFHFEYSKMSEVARFFEERLPYFSKLGTAEPMPITKEEFDSLWDAVYQHVIPQARSHVSWLLKTAADTLLKKKVYRLLEPTPTRFMYDWFLYAVQMMPTAAEQFKVYYPVLERLPLSIQHSRYDGTLPFEMAEELHKKLPHSRLVEYGKGYNHVSVLIRPDQAFQVVRDYSKFLG
jgi:pimeloyl-ACP methyl ester carboxylesterase